MECSQQHRPPGDNVELFTQLFTTHQEQIFRIVFCMVHCLNDAEDVFQQTALTMWEKFDTFQNGTNFVAWASTIARHNALKLMTARGRAGLSLSEEALVMLANQSVSLSSFGDARLEALAKCRRKLSEDDQTLLHECYSGNGSIHDVATRIGRSDSSVYVSLSRIRGRLYHCIQRALSQEGMA